MNRKDYRKMMEQKKRNKMYAKATILGALGLTFFGLTTQARAEEWKANSIEQIKESIRQAKDGIYIIKSGDTLSGISEATGITIDTLAKVNNIENVDLIYVGDKLIIKTETGKIALVDENNKVKNEVPLTKEDRKGIKEVQKQDTNNVYSNNSSSINSVATNNTTTDDNSNVVVKPVLPVTPKPDEKPELPSVKPEITEFDKNVVYQVEGEGTVFEYPTKVKVEGTVKDESGKFDIEYGFIDTTEKLPAGYKIVNEERDSYVKVFNTTANIVIYVEKIKDEIPVAKEVTATVNYLEDGNIIHTTTEKVKLGEDGFGTVNAVAPTGYEIVGDTSATVSETNTNVVFNVKKQAPTVEKVNVPVIYNLVDADGTFIKTLETSTQEFTKGDTVTVTAPTIVQGNTLVGSASQSVTVTDGTQVVFNYVAPYVPVHTSETVVKNVDTDGNVLSSTVGYEKVSESTDDGVTTTQPNGDTHTIYTTTIMWKKQAVTPPNNDVVYVDASKFGGRVTSASEVEGALTSNGLTFATWDGANDYGVAMQEANPHNTDFDGFNVFSIKMKDGSTRYVMEWHINL